MRDDVKNSGHRLLTRRAWLKAGGALGLAGAAAAVPIVGRAEQAAISAAVTSEDQEPHLGHDSGAMQTVGEVDHSRNGFDPIDMLTDFDYGTTSEMDDGRVLRSFDIIAQDREIEIAPGVYFPAWTFNGRVPGPTIRCVEGDRIRIRFSNAGTHPHTIHFHGIHESSMDGVPGQGDGMIAPGGSTVYEFDASPYGCHLYHCHAIPLKRHIHKGLYGAFIIDPDPNRRAGEEQALARRRNHTYAECQSIHEMVMVMNGFDTNFDGENEVYAANSIAFAYMNQMIPISNGELQRIYLVNLTEFDPLNSFHLHGNFFDYYDHGTTLRPTLQRIDTVMQCQGQRGILEFSYEGFRPGPFMFHAHQSEFAELGWMGKFDVFEAETRLA